jgi:hypothetical protein
LNNDYGDERRKSTWLRRLFYDLTHSSTLSRFLFFFGADILIVGLSLYLSFLVHFDFCALQAPASDDLLPGTLWIKPGRLSECRTDLERLC